MHEIAADEVNRALKGDEGKAIVAPSDYMGRELRNVRDRDWRSDRAEFLQVESRYRSRARWLADKERFV